jgi:outer membrane protein OmpA-like peptidoglycan-associated protein
MNRFILALLVLCILPGTLSCASSTKTGAVVGAASGAVIGGAIGSQSGNTVVGAILGAAVGGTAGAVIGNYMDKQAAEMERDLEGARVERIGEGIKITFDSGLLFDVNSYQLRPEARENLSNLSTILRKYDDTDILIEGHTDSDGSNEYNYSLSERRAKSVKSYLVLQDVTGSRMTTIGYGESQPVADNATEAGKQANRRVEVGVIANDELKAQAEKQAQG